MRISSTGLRRATGAAVLAVVALWAATALAAEAADVERYLAAEAPSPSEADPPHAPRTRSR